MLPRRRWSLFVVTLDTLVGWHGRMVRRHWTYSNSPKGRPLVVFDRPRCSLVVLLEEGAPGSIAHRGSAGVESTMSVKSTVVSARSMSMSRGAGAR